MVKKISTSLRIDQTLLKIIKIKVYIDNEARSINAWIEDAIKLKLSGITKIEK